MNTNPKQQNTQNGFIALISVIIISAILLGFSLMIGTNAFHSRFNTLNNELKRVSLGLAESCVNSALLEVAQNYSYTPPNGGKDIIVDSDSNGITEKCIIKSINNISSTPSNKIIEISTVGAYNGTFSNITTRATVNNPNPPITNKADLFVVTQFINDNGGTKTASSSTISISGGSPSISSFAGSENGVLVTIDANVSYSVSGNTVSGYSAPSSCSGSGINIGATVTCIITYDDTSTTGQITVIDNVNNSNGTGTKGPNDFPLYIDNILRIPGQPYTFNPGTHTVSATSDPNYSISAWGSDCNGIYSNGSLNESLQAGQNKTCIINYQDNTPPTPECAETVMMLDRTGTFFNSNAEADEEAAASSLLDLYNTLLPLPPKVGVGSFGGLYSSTKAQVPDGSVNQPLSGLMTTSYGNKSTTNGNTGTPLYPTLNITPNFWINPLNGEQNDVNFTTSSINSQQQGYGNFGFNTLPTNTIPANATITGVEIFADGKVSGGNSQSTSNIFPNATGNYNSWTANGNNNKVIDTNNTDATDATYINTSTNGGAQTFVLPNAGIPVNSTNISVSFFAIARGTNNGASIKIRLENNTSAGHQWDDIGHNLSTLYSSYQYNNAPTTINPATGVTWTVNDVNTWANNGGLRLGVVRTNSVNVSPRVTQIYAVVNYTPPPTGVIGIQLWNANSNTWTSLKTVSFSGTETSWLVSNSTDTWNKTWIASDFNNSNLKIIVQNNSSTGTTTSLNYSTIKVYYTTPQTGLYALIHAIDTTQSSVGTWQDQVVSVAQAELTSSRHVQGKKQVILMVSDGVISNGPTSAQILTATNNAKNSGIQIFGMHFGDPTGTTNFQQWVSGSTLPVSTITTTGARRSGNTVTITTSTPHNFAVNQRVIIAGVSNTTLNGTFPIISVPNNTSFTYTTTSSGTINSGNGTVTATNLFEAPNSSQMSAVFAEIGKQACPALAVASTPPPTTAIISVVTHVVNNSTTGTFNASNFTIHISGATLNPSTNDFSGVESPGVNITVNPGNYSIDETGNIGPYTKTIGAGCSGTITTGQNILCTIVNDDLPASVPLPPPPPTNIDLGSWGEN